MSTLVRYASYLVVLAGMQIAATSLLQAQTLVYNGPAAALNFGSVNVCSLGLTAPAPCSKTVTLQFKAVTTTTIASVNVSTQGAPNEDFTAVAGGTCAGTLEQGATCTVNVQFTPVSPGWRSGGVFISYQPGSFSQTLLTGDGIGPQVAFDPGQTTILNFGPLVSPGGMALDAAGNLYLANTGSSDVLNTPTVGDLGTVSVANTPYVAKPPTSVALDGAGSLYIAYPGASEVLQVIGGGAYFSPYVGSSPVGTGLTTPTSVAVDGAGNVFIAENGFVPYSQPQAGPGLVIEVPVNGGPQKTIYSSASYTNSQQTTNLVQVAVDIPGNVYVSEVTNSPAPGSDGDEINVYSVLKFPVGGGASSTVYSTTVYNPLSENDYAYIYPGLTIAVDGALNVYAGAVATFTPEDGGGTDSESVVEIAAGTGTITPLYSKLYIYDENEDQVGTGPIQLAVDAAGDVFFSDITRNTVTEIVRSQPPTLDFSSSAEGILSSTVLPLTVENIGNQPLGITGLNVHGDFEQVAGNGTPKDCTGSITLAAGTICNVFLGFYPGSVGALTGDVSLIDNSLNAPGSEQSGLLTGSGEVPILTLSVAPTPIAFGEVAFGGSTIRYLSIANTGNGTVTFAPTINGPSYSVATNSCGGRISPKAYCNLKVVYAPATVGSHNDLLTLHSTATVDPVIQLTGTSDGVTATTAALVFGTIPLGASETLPLTIANSGVSGTVKFTTSINGPNYKVLPTGNTCTAGLTAGHKCTLIVQFMPSGAGANPNELTIIPTKGPASKVNLRGMATER